MPGEQLRVNRVKSGATADAREPMFRREDRE